MNSYPCINLVFTQIDLSNKSNPHGIAIHQEIICGSNAILDMNIRRNICGKEVPLFSNPEAFL